MHISNLHFCARQEKRVLDTGPFPSAPENCCGRCCRESRGLGGPADECCFCWGNKVHPDASLPCRVWSSEMLHKGVPGRLLWRSRLQQRRRVSAPGPQQQGRSFPVQPWFLLEWVATLSWSTGLETRAPAQSLQGQGSGKCTKTFTLVDAPGERGG